MEDNNDEQPKRKKTKWFILIGLVIWVVAGFVYRQPIMNDWKNHQSKQTATNTKAQEEAKKLEAELAFATTTGEAVRLAQDSIQMAMEVAKSQDAHSKEAIKEQLQAIDKKRPAILTPDGKWIYWQINAVSCLDLAKGVLEYTINRYDEKVDEAWTEKLHRDLEKFKTLSKERGTLIENVHKRIDDQSK